MRDAGADKTGSQASFCIAALVKLSEVGSQFPRDVLMSSCGKTSGSGSGNSPCVSDALLRLRLVARQRGSHAQPSKCRPRPDVPHVVLHLDFVPVRVAFTELRSGQRKTSRYKAVSATLLRRVLVVLVAGYIARLYQPCT